MSSTHEGEYARILNEARDSDRAQLQLLDAARHKARTAAYPEGNGVRQQAVRQADRALYHLVRQIHQHRPRTLTVPQMATLLNVTRARIYQMIELAAPPQPAPPATPAQTHLPETDL